jgi:PAS domain S-box-containing protein
MPTPVPAPGAAALVPDPVRWQAALLEQIHQVVIAFDPAGRPLLWGRGAAALLGATPPPDLDPATWAMAPQAWYWAGPDTEGALIALAGRVYPVADDQGRRIACLVGADPAPPARPALPTGAALYRWIVESAQEGIWLVDAAGRTTFANARMADLLGYSRAEMFGRTLYDFMDAPARAEAEQNLERRRHGVTEQHEFRLRRKDGRYCWTLMSTNPLHGPDGTFLGALALVTDISARKQAEEALRQSEQRFAAVFHGSPDAISITRRADRQVCDVNESWERLFGYSRAEVLGPTVDAIGLWSDIASRDLVRAELRAHGEVRDLPVVLRHKSGRLFQAALSVEILAIEQEEYLLSICRDITAQKEMEARLLAAERLSALGRVAAGVAHEFNNVLAGIVGRLDLLALQPADPATAATLGEIQAAAEAGAQVVARIQALARLRTPSPPAVVPIAPLIQEVVGALQPAWQARRPPGAPPLTVHTVVDHDLAVHGTVAELRELLTHLLQNAVDAVPPGGEIAITAAAAPPAVLLTVQDSGPGIALADQGRVFEPFFTTKFTGSGLGLTAVRDIVARHGGAITLDSAPGAGTTVRILLPAAPGEC